MLNLIAACAFWRETDLEYLHKVAHEVVNASKIIAGGEIPGVGKNTTGYDLHVPGGTQNYYPAFWIRDAAMMLGSDLVPRKEVEGWIRVVAKTQPGPDGLKFPHNMRIPAFSIPDHISLRGAACWYPGAYEDQGVGNYGLLPPADDAFYFIQMVMEQVRQSKTGSFLKSKVATGWGDHTVLEVAERAFASVATDPKTGLVVCDDLDTRVDWGFCDSVRKTGSCLMPSLLRWQAADRLQQLTGYAGRPEVASQYGQTRDKIAASIKSTFYSRGQLLISATGIGRKPDVWASAFAVWLGLLGQPESDDLAHVLTDMYRAKRITKNGQVRHLPDNEAWEKTGSSLGSYQNGGYWATATGWLYFAIKLGSPDDAEKLLGELVAHIRSRRSPGAPYEWINPDQNAFVNGNYASSAGLVYTSIAGSRG